MAKKITIKQIFKVFSVTILILTFLCVYSFIVVHVNSGGQRLGFLTKPVQYFSWFPRTVFNVLSSNELRRLPPTYSKKDPSFEEKNSLNYNLYGINSVYNTKSNNWDIKLFNFKNDSILHTWHLYRENYIKLGDRKFENSRPRNSILLHDRFLIAFSEGSKNLYKLNNKSQIIWHNTEKFYHHSINLSRDSNIWACTYNIRKFKLYNASQPGYYIDDCITKIDTKTGRIMFDKSIADIFIENGYKNFVYGFSNHVDPDSGMEPFHLNDIQPVLKDGPYWKADDLFISLRNRSLILHYRPGTNTIIRLIFGPFLLQHDVDIVSDKEITIFNNNTTTIGTFNETIGTLGASLIEPLKANSVTDKLTHSDIIVYNYEDSTFNEIFNKQFLKEKIYTRTEGLSEFLSNGDVFVESQNESKVYIFNDEEILLKKQFDAPMEGIVYMTNWIRIYENIDF